MRSEGRADAVPAGNGLSDGVRAYPRISGLLRSKAVFLIPILLAAFLRFPDLGHRPMHADEGVHAAKFGTLLEGEGYTYDPSEYHGPTLYYLTLASAWIRGETRYVEIDEVTLRAVPAALGVALVAAHLGAGAFLGTYAAAFAALLAALSPAMVFYSRYYIHETPLVLFTFGMLLAVCRYIKKPGAATALLAGACAGLMHATKETAVLALGSMLLALFLTRLFDHWRGEPLPRVGSVVRGRDALLALLAAVLVSALLFSSFLSHPGGIVDSVRTGWLYLDRASDASLHFHPWDHYLRLLIHFPADGTPTWTEGLILALAAVGWGAGWSTRGVPGADGRILRFLGFYSLLMIAVYSAIPYKTPWCLLGFLHGLILLAGAGAVYLLRAPRRLPVRVLASLALVAAVSHLGWQAYSGAFRFAADPRNPYVYAHTGTDVFAIVRRIEDLARVHPDGTSMPVQIISRENLWPLPWYLRGLSGIGWWNGISETAENAPVIVVTPEMEGALVRKLYELPPPGERSLYTSIFEQALELRPRVELRGYADSTLWADFRRREAELSAPAGRAPVE